MASTLFSVPSGAVTLHTVAHDQFPEIPASWPLLGLNIWSVFIVLTLWRAPNWKASPHALPGTVFSWLSCWRLL
jgi:hypothetical protein